MNIYTKAGDKGKTSLYDGVKVSKDDIRVESYGTIDELGSFLGLAKNYVENETMYNEIQEIQNKLFTVATNLATEDHSKVAHYIVEEDIKRLEDLVDFYMGALNNPTGFIVNGSNTKSAYIHVARTVCRRGERNIIKLASNVEVDPLVIKYVNRLSDTLYAMARFLEEDQIAVEY
ncbi:MAG: cob(I)yrinic acid a,c-diamide adenosyltransferase [Tissierellia bacterium]|jgi:cob(I)alamin adenosyltransferase|nr:cob(I)yrinic acid a,c-diamide adenosyltransferase [Tissierellia bacterium]